MKIKITQLFFIFYSFCFSQGYMNAIGLGKFYSNQGTKNALDGLNLLSPSLSEDINFSNPSTWHNLKFTYLSLSYSMDHTSMQNIPLNNSYSGLSNALWIIPIKSKYSIGFSISPYLNQKVNIVGQDTMAYVAFDDTLTVSQSSERSGGILSFNLGSSYKLSNAISVGILANALFGSSRQNKSLNFMGSDIIQTSRSRYTGLISKFYFFVKLKNNLTLSSSIITTLKPLESAQLDKHLFDDANGNGFHDWRSPYFDFPFPDSVRSHTETRISDIHIPSGIQIGISKLISEKTSVAFEWNSNEDNSKEFGRIYSPLNNFIIEANSGSFLITRFASQSSLNFIDKISLRSGLKVATYRLNKFNDIIKEYGCSIGGGFKFKSVENQIDLNFCFGYRDYPMFSSNRELFQQFQASISLADIWFIKRRQK